MADFLLEIGTEEIPAAMVAGLLEELHRKLREALAARGLAPASERPFGAPRRLGLFFGGLPERQEDRQETVAGPPLAAARDGEGRWTPAALGFARKQGIDPAALREVEGPRGPCAGFVRNVAGRPTAEILAEEVPRAVDGLFLPKAMRWGEGEHLFVRPVRWVVALLDGEVVPLAVKGVAAGRASRGHRIHGPAAVEIPRAGTYFERLGAARVLPDPAERRKKVEVELQAEAARLGGCVAPDPELLDKMVHLCEWPTVVSGEIPGEFLSLPTEVLVTCLREHQNFFVVRNGAGEALPAFLAVVDGPGDPKGLIRKGLQNVSRSRLSDARFFYEHDVQVPLEDRLESLRGILFHPRLGSYHDKALRMEALARRLAPLLGAPEEEAAWAARHAKCDLASLLVQEKEFTSLQGIAGGLYARAQGKPEAVWQALYDHYRPLSLEDDLPRGAVGAVVALADKLDTLERMFRIGQVPSGSKDPFALRRAALGVVRILARHSSAVPLDLGAFLAEGGALPEGLLPFLEGRLRFLWEQEGLGYDEINAVLAAAPSGALDVRTLTRKAEDLHAVRAGFGEDFDHLAVAFKRARNILKGQPPRVLDPALFLPEADREGAGERALHAAVEAVREEAEARFAEGRYGEGLRVLARVRPAVDRFFDDVLVMCDPEGRDPAKTALQQNRLALLQRLVALFGRVADFSEIVPREG